MWRVYRKNNTRPTISAMPTAAQSTVRNNVARSVFAVSELGTSESVMMRGRYNE